jgi:hypothetical protein
MGFYKTKFHVNNISFWEIYITVIYTLALCFKIFMTIKCYEYSPHVNIYNNKALWIFTHVNIYNNKVLWIFTPCKYFSNTGTSLKCDNLNLTSVILISIIKTIKHSKGKNNCESIFLFKKSDVRYREAILSS